MSELEKTLLEYQKISKTLDLEKRANEKYSHKITNEECISVFSQTIENKYKLLRSYDIKDKIFINLFIKDFKIDIIFNVDRWKCNLSKKTNKNNYCLYISNDRFLDSQHFLDLFNEETLMKFFSTIELSLDDKIENEINRQIEIKSDEIDKLSKENDFFERISKTRKPNSIISVKGVDYKIGDTIFVVGKVLHNDIKTFTIDDFGTNNIGNPEAIEHIDTLNSYVDLKFYHNRIFFDYDNALAYAKLLELERKFKDTHTSLESKDREVLDRIVSTLTNTIYDKDINNKTMSIAELKDNFQYYITLNFDEFYKTNDEIPDYCDRYFF
jgi:hypothetical protein